MSGKQVDSIAGIVLAGGLSRRMGGGDKTLRDLAARPVLDHVIERARPQVAALAINANGDLSRFDRWGLPVVADSVPDFAGPLAGVLAGLDWAAEAHPGCEWVASFAADAPFLPDDLVARLSDAVETEGAEMACAESAGRRHPVFGLWPVALREELRAALLEEGLRKVDVLTARHCLAVAEFPADPVDPFFNVNRPEDLAEAERVFALAAK